jgi:hypothetical protein
MLIQDGASLWWLVAAVACATALAALVIHMWWGTREFKKKYLPIVDIDREIARRTVICEDLENRKEKQEKDFESRRTSLTNDYSEKRKLYQLLLTETLTVEEDLEATSFGVYRPHFEFDTPEKFKGEINSLRSEQKDMIRAKVAVACHTEWEVGGSKREGKRMTNQYSKLMLRAFNGECDSATLKVKWNNIVALEQRVTKAFAAINQLGTTHSIKISDEYLDLRLNELRATHEYHVKKHEEQEEQRRIFEQIREEEKAQREFEKARTKAEAEARRQEQALEKAHVELERATGEEVAKLQSKIDLLQHALDDALSERERVISRAQQTRSGHVYVISNVGSFGEDVFKIGLTRRLEPLDRVRELGDASVPFRFDVHAMIYSDDAPGLEADLHRMLEGQRVNMVNSRKEFFEVSLDEVETIVQDADGDTEFIRVTEAAEYRQTVALRDEERGATPSVEYQVDEAFPPALFS